MTTCNQDRKVDRVQTRAMPPAEEWFTWTNESLHYAG